MPWTPPRRKAARIPGRLFAKPADLRRIRRRASPVSRDRTLRLALTIVSAWALFTALCLLLAPVWLGRLPAA